MIDNAPLSPGQLGFFAGRAQSKAHDLVLRLFIDLAKKDDDLTRRHLATRLRKKPEQITRWLASPGNWTLETLSHLLVAMGYEPDFAAHRIDSPPPRPDVVFAGLPTSDASNAVDVNMRIEQLSASFEALMTSNKSTGKGSGATVMTMTGITVRCPGVGAC